MASRQDPFSHCQAVFELRYSGVLLQGLAGPLDPAAGGRGFDDPRRPQNHDRAADLMLGEDQFGLEELQLEADRPELIPFQQVEVLIGAAETRMFHDRPHPFGGLGIIFERLEGARGQRPCLMRRIKGIAFRKYRRRFSIVHFSPLTLNTFR